MKPLLLLFVLSTAYLLLQGVASTHSLQYALLVFLPLIVWATINRVQRLRDGNNSTAYLRPLQEGRIGGNAPTSIAVPRMRGIIGLIADTLLNVGVIGSAADKQFAFVAAAGCTLHALNFTVVQPEA